MRGMKHFILVVALGLAACAGQPSSTATQFALDADMSCNANSATLCPNGGCGAGNHGREWNAPISLHVPRGGGTGRFCLATGCENAEFGHVLTRAPGWSARMLTRDRTSLAGDLNITRDLAFTLRTPQEGETATWSGTCSPAGS